MTFNDLQPIFQAISTTADLTSIYLNIKNFKLKISGKTLFDVQKDESTIEDILTYCFIRKEILWQRPEYEDFNWCISSLIDLERKCDDYKSNFLSVNNDPKYFYSQLMRLFGDYCNEIYKELYRNNDTSGYDLKKPLVKLRRNSFKIIVTFIQFLPDGNLTKTQAYEKLELGCRNTKLVIKEILPDWTIE